LPRSKPPRHVETALLADKTYRELVERGRRVHSALVDRRRESISAYDPDSNMSTEEMWNILDT
jgi:hypothetical protein